MKRELVSWLRDPVSGEELELVDAEPAEDPEVRSGTLRSAGGTEYPIVDGVPVLVRADAFADGQQETVDSFSWKWEKAPTYRTETIEHYTRWYLERYGFETEEALARFLEPKERILDAGTAHGRDAAMYHRNGTGRVVGVDISSGIRNAHRDLGDLDRLHLVQGDLTRLPFPEKHFDFIGCDQVIHHTPDTRDALHRLLAHLAPGGHVAFYVYRKKGPIREFCDDYIRERTVPMSPDECLRVSEAITKFGKALSDLNVTIEVPEDIPILELKAGQYDLQRFLYYNVFKCYWNDTMSWESNVITNFDWYHPFHAHRHTVEEIRDWCEQEGLVIEHLDEQESGISVLGRKLD